MEGDSGCYIVEKNSLGQETIIIDDSDSPNDQSPIPLEDSDPEEVTFLGEGEYSHDTVIKRPDYLTASCLDSHRLQELQSELTEGVSSILRLPFDICRAMLRAYFWDKDKVIETAKHSSAEAYRVSSVENLVQPSSQALFTTQASFCCAICCEDSSAQKTLQLQCGQIFCLCCHKTYYEQNIFEGNGKSIQCPGSCGTLVQDETLEKNKYFVDSRKDLKWCPAPDCTYAVHNEATPSLCLVPSVTCLDGHSFCFGCNLGDHLPVLCKLAKLWVEKVREDPETANWLTSHTKECPKCHSSIEKNGGCNNMHCRNCRMNFCWLCLAPLSDHGNCNVYTKKNNASSTDENSRISIRRHLHFFSRYANQIESSKLDQKLCSAIEGAVLALRLPSDVSRRVTQFFRAAFNSLLLSRNTLRWSFALAFYLKIDRNKTSFQNHQKALELATEDLSGLLEEQFTAATLPHLKDMIHEKTKLVSLRRDALVTFVMLGYREDFWVYIEEVN